MGDKTKNEGNALEGFSFDTNETFFGIKPSEDDFGASTIKEVQGNEINKGASTEVTNIQTANGKFGTTLNEGGDPDEDGVTEEGQGEPIFFADMPDAPPEKPKDDKGTKPEVDTKGEKPKDDKAGEKPKETKEPKETIKAGQPAAQGTEGITDEQFYTNLAGDLKDRGIFPNIELKEGEEINEEQFFEIIEADIESRAEESVSAFAEKLDDDAKAFIKFKRDGGKTSDFFATYNPGAALGGIEDFDPKNDKQVETVLTNYYTRVKKLDGDELTEMLEDLKTRGTQVARATKVNQELLALDAKTKEELNTKTEQKRKERAEGIKAFNESIIADLKEAKNVGMFVVSEKDQKELAPYMTKATVKVGKDQYVPEFQQQLAEILKGDTQQNRWKLMIFAKLLKNNFELPDVATKAETKVTTTAKSRLRQQKEGGNLSTSGSYGGKKELSDFF